MKKQKIPAINVDLSGITDAAIDYSLSGLPAKMRIALKLMIGHLRAAESVKQEEVDLLEEGCFESLSVDKTCELFGIQRRQLYRLVDAGLPRNEDGTFDFNAVRHWQIEKIYERGKR